MTTKRLIMLWTLAFWFILGLATFSEEGAGKPAASATADRALREKNVR